MDFGDNEAEAAFRAEARTWLTANARELGPGERKKTLPEYRRDHDFVQAAKAWQGVKASGGWACLTWPQEYGGRGATPIENIIWNQEEALFDTAPNIFTIGQGMLGPTMMVHGSAEQQER